MSANTNASQADSPAKTDTEVPTQSTLERKKGSLLGDVYIDEVPCQRFTLDGVEGEFTCKYFGARDWTTQESGTVPMHRWICKHSSDPSEVHIDNNKKITGTHLPELLPPGLVFRYIDAPDWTSPGTVRLSGATYDVTDEVHPAVFIDALQKTSNQGPFVKLDYTHWTYGEREDTIDMHRHSLSYRFTKCQDRLVVLGTLKEVAKDEFNDFDTQRRREGMLSKPVRDDMTFPGTSTVS